MRFQVHRCAIASPTYLASIRCNSRSQLRSLVLFRFLPSNSTSIPDRPTHVFPQAHLPTIVDGRIIGQNWKGSFRHIDEKSVDFVLCDKAYIAPVLAIELDDKTHTREDRIMRDKEVERILSMAELPLLHLENHGHFDPEMLLAKVNLKLKNESLP